MSRTPSWLSDVPLAHRGLHGDGVPENSLAAFAAARAAGVGVELDVWATRDGVAVVTHDHDLSRLAGDQRLVADVTADDVSTLRLGDTGERIPTLADALDVLGDTPVMVEVKNPSTAPGPAEVATLAAAGAHRGPWCVASFNPRTVGWFATHAPDVIRVQTSGLFYDVPMPSPVRWSLRTLRWLRRTTPHAVSYEVSGIDQPPAVRYRERGGVLLAWTVRTPDELALARTHADNIIFETPLTPLEATSAHG